MIIIIIKKDNDIINNDIRTINNNNINGISNI